MMKDRLIQVCDEEIQKHPLWKAFNKCMPGWRIRFCEMDDDCDERICWDSKIIWLAMWRHPDPETRAAHAVAHVRLHYGILRPFTDEECRQADDLAACWLICTAAGGRVGFAA